MIVWFGGGLGNQLFQYSLLKSAQEKGYDVKADLSYYDMYNCHNGYELKKVFDLDLPVCSEAEIGKFNNRYSIIARAIRKIGFIDFDIDRNIIREDKGKYINDLISDKNKACYLWGYWQTDKYFNDIQDKILSTLIFPKLVNKNEEIAEQICGSLSTSIHVRKGDYTKDKNFSDLVSGDYYQKSINYISERFSDVKYFVFSDDPEWCTNNLNLPPSATYVTWNTKENAYNDMHLMSLCKNNIIANSSFSWWGAQLNKNREKTVIAPKYWYNKDSKFNGDNIVPKEWVKI